MKYEIEIQNQFEFEWLEDLENEKLGAVQLVLKIALETSYLALNVKTINEAYEENGKIGNNDIYSLTWFIANEVKQSVLKIGKLTSILKRKKEI